MTRERIVKEERKKRVPMGVQRMSMDLDDSTKQRLKSEGKKSRWVNDEDTRIQQALDGGYDFVEMSREAISRGEEEQEDKRIKMHVGKKSNGEGLTAYLMAIPIEFYNEDQRTKEEKNRQVDAAIRGGTIDVPHHGVGPAEGGIHAKHIKYKP